MDFKINFSRPHFNIIFSPEMLKFHPYSILTRDTIGEVRNVEISRVAQQLLCCKSHDFLAVFALALDSNADLKIVKMMPLYFLSEMSKY